MPEDPKPSSREYIEKLQGELRTLLGFAVKRAEIEIDDGLIDSVVAACSRPSDPSPALEAELWQQFNRLAAKIGPATPETVLDISDMEKDVTDRPQIMRRWWRDHLVRRMFGGAILWMATSAFLLLGVQIYALLVTNSLDKIATAEKNVEELLKQRGILEKLTETAGKTEDETVKNQVLAQQDELSRRLETQVQVAEAAAALLPNLSGLCNRSAPSDCGTGPASDPGVDESYSARLAAVRHVSSIFADSVSLFILPLLYGWLGANVYILRRLLSGLDSWSISRPLATKLRLRRYLGALLGSAVGLIYHGSSEQFASAGLSLALFAFLAGYSVEFIFSLLDAVIDRGKAAFQKPKPAAEPSQTDGQGQAQTPPA